MIIHITFAKFLCVEKDALEKKKTNLIWNTRNKLKTIKIYKEFVSYSFKNICQSLAHSCQWSITKGKDDEARKLRKMDKVKKKLIVNEIEELAFFFLTQVYYFKFIIEGIDFEKR